MKRTTPPSLQFYKTPTKIKKSSTYPTTTTTTTTPSPPHVEKIPEEKDAFLSFDDELNDASLFPSDTMVGLQLIKSQFPRLKYPKTPPIILLSILYSVLEDRTSLDRELDQLKKSGVLRLFKLGTGKNDYSIVMMDDYRMKLDALKMDRAAIGEKRDAIVLDAFLKRVLSQYHDVNITKDNLVNILYSKERVSGEGSNNDNGSSSSSSNSNNNNSNSTNEETPSLLNIETIPFEDAITILVSNRLLTLTPLTSLEATATYTFSIPHSGGFLTCILKGRKEVVGFLKRRKYNEVLEDDLLKRKLKSSDISMKWHIGDLLGLSVVERIDTTSGSLIRLVNGAGV